MDRVSIKNKAKELIKGNLWYIWKPMLIYTLIVLGISLVTFTIDYLIYGTTKEVVEIGKISFVNYNIGPFSGFASALCGLIGAVFTIWYAKYILDFIRGNKKEASFNDFFEFFKKHILICFVTSLLVGLNIGIGFILLIVPGIMAAFGLMLYNYVLSENLTLGVTDILKKTWNMTKGHKMDLFVLLLSFIGWSILATLTLGILYIWLMPYMTITLALAYESLK